MGSFLPKLQHTKYLSIEAAHPEALIYEPEGDRRWLVGVEYTVDAATWLAEHSTDA